MLLHASTVDFSGQAVLLGGPPGIGKSDLALRLIDAGARLVSDDQTFLRRDQDILRASPPAAIGGLLEIRHVGLIQLPFVTDSPVALYVELTGIEEKLERLPAPDVVFFLDLPVRRLRLPAQAASTPAKIRAVLTDFLVP